MVIDRSGAGTPATLAQRLRNEIAQHNEQAVQKARKLRPSASESRFPHVGGDL